MRLLTHILVALSLELVTNLGVGARAVTPPSPVEKYSQWTTHDSILLHIGSHPSSSVQPYHLSSRIEFMTSNSLYLNSLLTWASEHVQLHHPLLWRSTRSGQHKTQSFYTLDLTHLPPFNHIIFRSELNEESDCSGKEQSREKKDKDTSSYPGSFHNTEVVQSPLHFQGDFTIITKITTAQYFLSMRLHKTMLKHTRKSLPMLKH
ncbi:hypothetical protein MTR_6g036390 [Medicago truncatula]|uniref:Transmembrane protein n=1 Tax=Medicago truncatula TaxID=3880 RepID=G7KHQ1_MEDTR|nr:hypothetical protein MTR_6g036390 [Medicago truncatula]